jgi:hypothetical protein
VIFKNVIVFMLLERKQVVSDRVLYVEGIWDFYFDLFVQRLSNFGERLRAVDRIAAGCYEKVYVGLGTAQPTPYLRVPISLILLRRLGLKQMATNLMRIWQRLYPRVTPNDIPPAFMKTFQAAAERAVDTMVFQPYPQLANQSMAQVVTFGPEQMQLIELAGQRLARGLEITHIYTMLKAMTSQNLSLLTKITVNDLNSWIDRFASIESPSILAAAGQFGLDSVTDQADTLFWVIGLVLDYILYNDDGKNSTLLLKEILSYERVKQGSIPF